MNRRASRLSITPGAAIAVLALFFALGGSAFAVGERTLGPSVAQQRCTNGAVRGIASVTGDPSKGIANIPDQFSSANVLFSRKFNCNRRAVQVRRTAIGVYEVRFVGNAVPNIVANGIGHFSASVETIGPGTFRVRVQNVGRADEGDGPFVVIAA
ncbi:MAG TPA: hypothetical protein VMN35_01440 [Gaiellaceae bacterium]|nr:hypothetical protein [Gaiellaceae bacterium]